MSIVPQPQARTPIGEFTMNGSRVDVELNPYWYRIFNAMLERAGGYSALTNQELESKLQNALSGEMTAQPYIPTGSAEFLLQPAESGSFFADVMQGSSCEPLQDMTLQR